MKIIDYINESVKKKLTEMDANIKLKSYVQMPDGRKGYVKRFKIGDGDTMLAIIQVIEDGKTTEVTTSVETLEKATMKSAEQNPVVKINYTKKSPYWISAEIADKEQRMNPEAVVKAIDIFNKENNPDGLPVEYTVFNRKSSLDEIKKLMSLGKYTAYAIGTNPKTNESGKFIIHMQLENFTPEYAEMMQALFKEIDGGSESEVLDFEDKPNVFTYYINLDERGSFYADVRDEEGETVFEIHDFEIFEDGFMSDKHDMDGLKEHLVSLGIMAPGDKLEDNDNPHSSLSESKRTRAEIIQVLEHIKTKIKSIK